MLGVHAPPKLCLVAVAVAAMLFSVASEASAYTLRVTKASGRANYPSNGTSVFSAVSKDGRFVAFQSYATNFSPSSALSARIFLRDMRTGEIRPVSLSMTGGSPDGFCSAPAVSADGRYVVYSTAAADVVPDDTNSAFDVVRRDMLSGETTCVSSSLAGVPAGGDSHSPSVSADGRYVAFVSSAPDLVPGDTGRADDVFVRDMMTGTTMRISTQPGGGEAQADSSAPSISADGSKVAFASRAASLVASDTNGSADVFVWSRASAEIARASVSSSEREANGSSFAPVISGDGTKIAFESVAGNLVGGDVNGARDVFVRDLVAGTTTRASVGSRGAANREAREPSISSDGRRVAFSSAASNLVSGDTNGVADIFVRDLVSKSTSRINRAPKGVQANGTSGAPAMAADGVHVTYDSSASNLAAFDTNRRTDVFLSSWGKRTYLRVTNGTAYSGTAVATSLQAFPRGAGSAVIANPSNWSDVLAATALAGTVRGPLLYAARTAVPTITADEIRRLGATQVYVVGNSSAIDATAAASLASLPASPTVTRLSGATKYSVATSVASRVVALKGTSWDKTVFVASGATYSESLAAVPVAAVKSRPFVFLDSSGRYKLPAGTKRAIILGRTTVVSRSVESRLKKSLGTSSVTRLAGSEKYSTAVKTADYGIKNARLEWNGVTLAASTRPAEAACAGILAGRAGTVVLLTAPTSVPSATRYRLGTAGVRVDTLRVVGPTRSVSSSTLSAMKRAMGGF